MSLPKRIGLGFVLALVAIGLFYISFRFDELVEDYGLLWVLCAGLILGAIGVAIAGHVAGLMRRR